MSEQRELDDANGPSRRFDVELFIVHPTMAPAEITGALGMEPQSVHGVGEPRRTPKGTSLPGNYQDTRWRFSSRYEIQDQWFSHRVEELVDRLIPHKDFFGKVRSTGGTACIVIQFLNGYFGDKIAREILAKALELELDLGIECFDVPQN